MPDEVALREMQAVLRIRRAVNDPELFRPVQCANLSNVAVGHHQPSITGEININAFFLLGRQGDKAKIRRKGRTTRAARRGPFLFGPMHWFQGKGAIIRQIDNRQGFVGGIGQCQPDGSAFWRLRILWI